QAAMAEAIDELFESGGRLLVEAGAGEGKNLPHPPPPPPRPRPDAPPAGGGDRERPAPPPRGAPGGPPGGAPAGARELRLPPPRRARAAPARPPLREPELGRAARRGRRVVRTFGGGHARGPRLRAARRSVGRRARRTRQLPARALAVLQDMRLAG